MVVRLAPGVNSEIRSGGKSVVASVVNTQGGYIVNPQLASDQGLLSTEVLYVDPTAPASIGVSDTTIALQPGQYYFFGPQTTPVYVNAVTSGHRFTVVSYIQPTPYPPINTAGAFPPSGPTTQTKLMPSYLYQQYNDDDALNAFVYAYNSQAQNYIDTLNALNLPIYTGLYGALLDWVGAGLYGMPRPALSSGLPLLLGPFNTLQFNVLEFNELIVIEPDVVYTSDDLYKRILTWHIYKGDGKVFNIRWFKRRIMRFLIGTGGSAPNIDNTDQISLTFGSDGEVDIHFIDSSTAIVAGAIFDNFEFNSMQFNELETEVTPINPLPNILLFTEAMESGALEIPFQVTVTIT